MVYLYDDAIVKDFRDKIKDERIAITPFDNINNYLGKSEGDRIQLPVISVDRRGWSLSDSRPHTMKFTGELHSINDDETVTNVQEIPIRINYVIDVWTRRRLENDNIMRELIFYYSTHPTLKINIPYGLDSDKVFNIMFDSEVEDNSDIPNHINIGEFVRQSISFYVDDAYLWKASNFNKTYIDTDGMYLEVNKEIKERVGDMNVEID